MENFVARRVTHEQRKDWLQAVINDMSTVSGHTNSSAVILSLFDDKEKLDSLMKVMTDAEMGVCQETLFRMSEAFKACDEGTATPDQVELVESSHNHKLSVACNAYNEGTATPDQVELLKNFYPHKLALAVKACDNSY